MFYQEILPQPALRPYINCLWVIRSCGPGAIRDRVFPDGCQEIVFNIDTTVLRGEHGIYSITPRAVLIGQMTKPYELVTHGSNTYFGVQFYPHSFAVFTREPIYNLRDQPIDLRYLLKAPFMDTADAIFENPTFERFVALIEDYFLRRLADTGPGNLPYRVVDRAVGILLREKTRARIEELPGRLNTGERSLQLMFRYHVGLSPKHLLKVIRFQTTFRYLNDMRYPLTDIAYHCGYCDHSHFTHDFKSLTGVTPSAYRAIESPFNRLFLNETSRTYLCNNRD